MFIFSIGNQPDHITGVVYDNTTKEPVENVLVTNEKTSEYTTTNSKGEFSIEATKGQFLLFSKLGLRSLRQQVTSKQISVAMEEEIMDLDEVTVTAKQVNDIDIRSLAGAITVIDVKRIANRPEMDLLRLLQGQVPGLVVTIDGELGVKPKVRIRGESSFITEGTANEPLFVLDGITINSDAFYALNVEDIDKIKVLKDAAAKALYGIKAANGVIELTSKRGYKGDPYVSVNINYGITLRGSRGVEMMDSSEKLELERLLQNNSTPGYFYSEEYYRKYHAYDPNIEELIAYGAAKLDSLRGINTDWFNELIKINTYQSYTLGIRGGNEKNTYYISATYGKQGGRVEGNNQDRLSARSNFDFNISSKFVVGLNLGLGYSKSTTANGNFNPTSLVYNLNPYEQKYDPATGEGVELYSYPGRTYADFLNQYNSTSTSKQTNISVFIRWDIMDGLYASAVMGGDIQVGEKKSITPPSAYSEKMYSDAEKGIFSQNKGVNLNGTSNFRINYNKVLGEHDITLSVNSDYSYSDQDDIGLVGYGLASKVSTANGINQGLTGARKTTINSKTLKSGQLGYGTAAGYSFQEIYDVYASYKKDGSSLMPASKRWNTAWSIGGGWRPIGYSFLSKSKIITDLKFRLSYGYTASLAGVEANMTVKTYSYSSNIYANDRIFQLQQLPNKDLKPQKVKTINAGMDIGMFKRFSLRMDAYRSRTMNALLNVTLPPSNGYSNMMMNVGVLENSGIEFNLSGDIIRIGDFCWNSALSLSYNRNKVLDLYAGDKLYVNSDIMLPDMQVGKSLSVLYGLRSLGINSLDGMPRFLSAAGEELSYQDYGKLSVDDYVVLGHTTPPYTGFFNHQLTYKSFMLSFDLYFTFNGIQKYSRDYVRINNNAMYNAVKGQTQDMWFEKGDENKIYYTAFLPSGAASILDIPSTETVYKTDYIRLNNVRFSYAMPPGLIRRLSNNTMKYLRLKGCYLLAFDGRANS